MKKLISIIASGLLLVSCIDTVILPDDKTVEEDFWQTKNDVTLMVNGAYSKMATSGLQQRLVVWTSRSDELNLNSSLNNRDLNQIYSANIQTTNSYANWSDLYAVINACNLVIAKSEEVMDIDPNYMEGDHLNNVAQMKALRSLCYFYLVRVFRDVPLILEPYKNSSQEMNVPQVAPSVVIDQIIADLEEVKNNALSTQAIPVADWTRCGYFTRDGIYALLADVYLWKASIYGDEYCYDKVIEYSNIIRRNRENAPSNPNSFGAQTLDDDGWGLSPASSYYNQLFSENGNGQESLFELQFTNNEGLCVVYNRINNNANAQPQFYASKPYAKVGTGRANYVFDNTSHYIYDVRGFESVYDFNGAAEEGFFIRKHVGMNGLTFMGQNPASAIRGNRAFNPYNQNWVVYRATDVMLMKAEALVQKALIQAKAQAGLVEQLATVSTVKDSLALADQLFQINQTISRYNVEAVRQVQIVNTRAIHSTDESTKSPIDSTKYAVSSVPFDSIDVAGYVNRQVSAFNSFAATASDLELLVMDERARELCFEGKRWFDMLRYNYRHVDGVNYGVILAHQGDYVKNYDEMLNLIARKYTSGGGKGVTAKMPTEPYLYMPIIESEMEVNNALEQNPVYSDGGTIEKN